MKGTIKERRLKKMALYFAKILDYDKVVRLKNWNGCPIFEPRYKDDTVKREKIPMIIVIRNGATYSLPADETVEYIATCYPDIYVA